MSWTPKDDERLWRTGNLVFGTAALGWVLFFILVGIRAYIF